MKTNCCKQFRAKWPQLVELQKHGKNPKLVKALLKSYSNDKAFCSVVRLIAKNVKSRNIKVKGALRKKLLRHKKKIEQLAKKNNKSQARLVQQSGGWLLPLIPAIGSVVASIINAVGRKRK